MAILRKVSVLTDGFLSKYKKRSFKIEQGVDGLKQAQRVWSSYFKISTFKKLDLSNNYLHEYALYVNTFDIMHFFKNLH